MLSLFRTNQQIFGFLLFLYAALLRLPMYWSDAMPPPTQVGVAGQWFERWAAAWGPIGSGILAVFLVGVLGFLAVYFMFRYRLGPKTNLFPGVFTVLAASALPAFLPANSYQVANICLVMALLALGRLYRTPAVANHIFNVGWWIGVATLFVPQYLLFLLMAVFAMTTLRAFRLREMWMMLIGAFLPLLLVGFYYFWIDGFARFWQVQFVNPFGLLAWWQDWPPTITEYIWSGVMLLLLLIVLFSRGRYLHRTTLEEQKRIKLFYWVLLFAGLSVLFISPVTLQAWQVLVLPVGVLLSLNFTMASRGVAEVLHLLLVVIVLSIGFATAFSLF